jgi:hypothetical protein
MKNLTPILLIAVSVGVFFMVIDPAYEKVQDNSATIDDNSKMIDLANELRRERENLNARFNNISEEDKQKLEKVLPDAVDNVRLIRDIQDIAVTFGIEISNIGVTGDSSSTEGQTERDRERDLISNSGGASFGKISLSFSVANTSYDNFKAFMRRLEDFIRLVDVREFSVAAAGSNLFNYSVTLDTYWLR